MVTKLLLILCLLIEACSLKAPGWINRGPSSQANFEVYKTKMNTFKTKILGSEQDAKCSQEQIDDDFDHLMASLKKDSCSGDNFTINKDEFVQKKCPKIKTEGLFDRIVKKTIAEEKSKKPLSYFQNKVDPEFLSLVQEAHSHLETVNSISADENYSIDERIDLIAAYVEDVLLPIRDLVVIKHSYVPKENDGREYYNNLRPFIPQSFAKELSAEQLGLLTQGPNPSTTPFYMEIATSKEGSYYLNFSPADIIKHDVLTLLKAPTSKNYVLAMKWMTLQMMLSQVYLYNTLLGSKGAIQVPNSCQNQFNGNLPSEFKFKFEEGVGEKFLENILVHHGLSYSSEDSSFLDYYVNNVNNDPTKDGYSGMIPFENYKNAKMNFQKFGIGRNSLRPQFDDVAHFKAIMSVKSNEALSVFRGTIEKRSRATSTKQNIIYSGYDTFKSILGEIGVNEVDEIKRSDGTTQQFYPGKQNLSPYLVEQMKKYGLIDFTQLISERMKKKFVGKKVWIEFPSMYSSPIWRDWSLKLLADHFYRYKDVPTSSDFHRLIRGNCNRMLAINSDIDKLCSGNSVKNLSDLLSEFRSGEKYIPTRRLEERKFQNVYPLLGMIWQQLRDATDLLPEAKPYELNFLLDQMYAGNPWARIKMGYMVALDQLESQKDGIPPVYEKSGLWFSKNEKAACDSESVDLQYSKIKEAGAVLGLNLPLTYDHASRILSDSQRDSIYGNIIEEMNQNNAQLFSVKSGNKDFYGITESLSYKTILTRQSALNTGVSINQSTKNEIEQVAKTNEAIVGDFFFKLYNLRTDVEKQKKLFEDFSKVNGIDNVFSLKLNFLAVDESYKKPIYKDILKQAAMARRGQILSRLDSFCKMNINNQEDFKNIFYQTSKAQNELNQAAGLPGIPSEVMEKINKMSPAEFRDMWWGIGSGVAGMAAIVVGGACTVATGGICAPLGGVMAAAGVASIGIQIKLTGNELERKYQADESEREVKSMEDLGFAKFGSSESVHRSYAWAAFDAISIFPLVGIATKSVTLGPKLMVVSAKSMMNETGKTAFRAAAKTAAQEGEVRSARYLLGLDSVSENLGLDDKTISSARVKIEKIRALYTSGEIDLNTMLSRVGKVIDPIKRAKLAAAKTLRSEIGKVIVKESPEEINQRTAQIVANYFAENPKDMLRMIKSYSGERLESAIKIMAEINSKDRIGRRIPIYSGVRDWFFRMRNESLAKNASKIVRIEKELETLGSEPRVLENYIKKNMEDLTDVFMDIPMKKRELPYIVQIQGMPEFNFIKGRRIPFLSVMSEGQTLKKVFTARARLVFESYKAEARSTLKLKRFVKAETTLGAFLAFQHSVAEMASKKNEQEVLKIMTDYHALEEKFTQKLFLQYKESGKVMEYKAFKTLVTAPANLREKAIAETVWESVPADELMEMKEVAELAHKAVYELANYSDVDSFQHYINALRILVINRNPAVLDI